jgi:heme/copper-type cytochrome/quinol oxidase subunit 3
MSNQSHFGFTSLHALYVFMGSIMIVFGTCGYECDRDQNQKHEWEMKQMQQEHELKIKQLECAK